MASNVPFQAQLSEDNKISCWVCFATVEDDRQAAWVRPCRCKGTTKWVHRACLQRWVDEKQNGDLTAKVACPQCNTEYMISVPRMGLFLRSLNLTDRVINQLCPFVAGGVFIGSVYWTAVTYGAISVMQVLGHKEGLTVMERADPLFLLIGLPTIPVGLVVTKMFRWEDYVLDFIRRQSAKVSVLQDLMQLPAGQEVARAPMTQPISDPLSATRVLCGALVMPTIATIVGKFFFPQVQNNLHRSILGGISFTLVKGLLKIYYKQQQYLQQLSREIQNYPDGDQSPVFFEPVLECPASPGTEFTRAQSSAP